MSKQTLKNSQVILAFDVSSSCTGYAVIRSGKWRLSKKSWGKIKIPPKLPLAERLFVFRNGLEKVINTVKPTSIVIEDVFALKNVKTLKLLARFNGVALEVSRRYSNKEPLLVLTSTVRAFLKSGKSKEETFDFICKKYSLAWKFKEMNDIADAIVLGLYAVKYKDTNA